MSLMRKPFGKSLPSSIVRDDEPEWGTNVDQQNANHIYEVYPPGS
jgi:hypothetical protein